MALSGTRDDSYTVSNLLDEVFTHLQVKRGGNPISSVQAANGIAALKGMLRTWSVKGIRLHLWPDRDPGGIDMVRMGLAIIETKQPIIPRNALVFCPLHQFAQRIHFCVFAFDAQVGDAHWFQPLNLYIHHCFPPI